LISAQPKSRLVIPANAGIQAAGTEILDSRFRGNDKQSLLRAAFVAQFSISLKVNPKNGQTGFRDRCLKPFGYANDRSRVLESGDAKKIRYVCRPFGAW
jgi:hypothetical protein